MALVIGVAWLLVLAGRDDATTRTVATPGQVVPAQDGPDGELLGAGNVLLVVADRSELPAARRLAAELAGAPASPALERAGQAVIVRPAKRGRAAFVAVAIGRTQAADRADDPALRRFVEYWLARGA